MKYQSEKESISRIFRKIPNGQIYLLLWEEFEIGESPEAKLIRQIDKLEMACQAGIYEHQLDLDLEDFFKSAGKILELDELQKIFEELVNIRQQE
jgi:putative hydrolase of HD superfamily